MQVQLVQTFDQQMCDSYWMETQYCVERFTIGGHRIEIELVQAGEVAAYITTKDGRRITGCQLNPNDECGESIKKHLGLDDATESEMTELVSFLRSIAA